MMLGARGVSRIAASGSWPVLAGDAVTNPPTPNATIAFALPSGYQNGDLLVLLMRHDGNYSFTTPSGWTLVAAQYNSYYGFKVYSKIAAGTEGSTVNVTCEAAEADHGGICLRISGADTINGTTGIAYSTNPNMVAHTPIHSGKKYLYICAHAEAGNLTGVGTPPTNYTAGSASLPSPVDGNESSIRYCYRNFLEDAEDPGQWLIGGSYPSFGTFAIYAV